MGIITSTPYIDNLSMIDNRCSPGQACAVVFEGWGGGGGLRGLIDKVSDSESED